MRSRNLSLVAAALMGAGCGTATSQPEADVLGSLQHGLESRLEQKFGKGARVQQVFGVGDEVVLGVTLEANVEESDVRQPLALARYREADDALTLVTAEAGFYEARLLPSSTALVSSTGELTELSPDGTQRTIASGVKGDVTVAPGGALLFTREGGTGESSVVLADAKGTLTVVADSEGVNDRPFVSPDGKTVVFVSGRTGIASLWRTTLDGAAPVQVTNSHIEAGVERDGEAEPAGFVPPPVIGDRLEWLTDDVIRYDAGEGEFWKVNVRTGAAAREGVSP